MIVNCNIKTITEIDGNKITISSSAREDDEKPKIFRSDLLSKEKTINGVSGKEGELLLTHIDSNLNVGEINDDGDLIINTSDDDNNNYQINEKGELIYNETR